MARRPRLNFAGAIHHVTTRGIDHDPIYIGDDDRRAFLDMLSDAAARHGWTVYAYCLMTNHYHLLIRTDRPTLSAGMRELNGRYAARFNRRQRRGGYVFQRRYASSLVESELHLHAAGTYIEMNPVRAGMVKRPEDWPWSSRRFSAG